MERRIVKLSTFSPEIEFLCCYTSSISKNLQYLCALSLNGTALIYFISRNNESRPIWRSTSKVHSYIFSEDENQFMVLYESKLFEIYSLDNDAVELLAKKSVEEISVPLEKSGIDISESSELIPHSFNSKHVILIINNKWLICLNSFLFDSSNITNKIELTSCVKVVTCRANIYSLTTGGNISSYSLEDGKPLGVVNLYSLLPRGHSHELGVFTNMRVSEDGSVVAVATQSSQVFVANIQSHFQSSDQNEEECRWDSGASVMSFNSGTSHVSTRTTSSLLRAPIGGDNTSLSSFEMPEREKVSTYRSNWNSYLKSLKQKHSHSILDGASDSISKNTPSRVSGALTCIAEAPTGMVLRSLHVGAVGVSLWFTEPTLITGGQYLLCGLPGSNTATVKLPLPVEAAVVAGGFLGLLDAFISPSHLGLFLGSLSRDVLVGKLLHYMQTESIGRLLQGEEWGDLVVPLPALADGLRLQQMDVARLALGLHAQAFKSAFAKSSSEDDTSWQMRIDTISMSMDKLFNTIHHAIQENAHKATFRDHLVILSLDHGNDLLQFLHDTGQCKYPCESSSNVQAGETLKGVVKRVMYHVVELRRHLHQHARARATVNVPHTHQPLEQLSEGLKTVWKVWEEMVDDAVIHDAVSRRNIPLAQVFLLKCRGWNPESFSKRFKQNVDAWLLQLLANKEIERTTEMLINLGSDPYEELRKICMRSLDVDLRDNLAEYLGNWGLLKFEEIESWRFLKDMENILEDVELPSPRNFHQQVIALPQSNASEYEMSMDTNSSGRLSIATIACQDAEWRSMVVVDLFFNIPGTMLEGEIDAEVAWKYLLHYSREDILIAWINCFFCEDSTARSSHKSCADIEAWLENIRAVPMKQGTNTRETLTLDDILSIFSSWSITQTMIDCVSSSDAMQRTKNMVMDEFSRFGVFSSSEKKKASSILQRVIKIKSLHKLEQILNQSTANVTYKEFQYLLTEVVIKNQLYELAFPCLQDCEYSEDEVRALCHSSSIDRDKEMHWFKIWLLFRQLSRTPKDEALLYQSVVQSAQYLGGANLQTYLREHPLVVMALITFGKESVSEVFLKEGTASIMDKQTLESTLKQLPILETALSSLHNCRERKPDVTVYQLLQGYSQFDTAKLFGWQEMNLIKGEEFPHFTSSKLIARYGSVYTLTYLHYLKYGRPSYAFNKFIVDQVNSHGKLTKKSIKEACGYAHGLALQNFDDTSVTCGCIAFVEMLGHDSNRIRVHAAAANKILNYLNSKTFATEDTIRLNREQVVNLLYGLVQGRMQCGMEMLLLLETALQSHNNDCVKEGTAALLHWQLAVKFAILHKLILPEMFLKQCAAEDKWLEFVLFIDLYNYPLDQVMHLVGTFHSRVLREHLTHAFSYSIKRPEKREAKLTLRDSRKSLYSKIGVKKGETGMDSSTEAQSPSVETNSIPTSSSSEESTQQMPYGSVIGDDIVSIAPSNSLFLTLLRCHISPDPPRALLAACQNMNNPVFAVLATCYEPSSVLGCFCVWLLTCLSGPSRTQLTHELAPALQQHTWSAKDMETLLVGVVRSAHITSLYRGFKIFLPETPLCALSDFLYESIVKKNFKSSIINIKLFKAACLNLKKNPSLVGEDDFEGMFLNNGFWVASIAVRLVIVALAHCLRNTFYELQFVNILLEACFTDHLPVVSPDLERLARLLEILIGTDVHPDLGLVSLGAGEKTCQHELQHCIDKLVHGKHFQQALQLAALVDLPMDDVLTAQWSDNFELYKNEPLSFEEDCNSFWSHCHDTFREANIRPHVAVRFFKEHAEKVEDLRERYYVLYLAVEWYQQMEESKADELETLQRKMWTCWLHVDTELQIGRKDTGVAASTLLCSLKAEVVKASGVSSLGPPISLNSEKKVDRLNSLIRRLLDRGDVVTSCRLEAMFNHKNQDLQLLLTCMELAEGEITPYQLSAEQRLLLSESRGAMGSSYRRRTLLSSVSTMSHSSLNYSISADHVETPFHNRQDTLTVLERLAERMAHGRSLGNRVVMCYRVAMNLDKSYQEIIALKDPLSLLKTAIADDCLNKFIVASDLMSAAQISSEEVAEFLCAEIVTAVSRQNPPVAGDAAARYIWGCNLDANFHLVLDICDDPSMLGTKLLAVSSRLGATQLEAINEVHVVIVELMVRAHDCFTAACNVEGIAAVLQKARSFTASLQNYQEWALMVRLLTGVGRYTEMNYIFQILRESDQFEFLLGKGLVMVSGLKMAVLDFLKLHCPEDRKLFQMVAIHFAMFGELARLWDSDARAGINSLLTIAQLGSMADAPLLLTNTEDNRHCLREAMEGFRNAAEFFLKANKLTRALASAHQAELVALQIFLVSSVPVGQGADSLLKLNAQQIAYVIVNKLSFPQACIVARAYSHPVDWGAALYQHCIVHREESYLADFTHNMTLTTALVEDVARRFQMDNNVNHDMAQEMKKFVQCVTTVEVKYRVASQLGFKDIIESLINGPDVAVLKDTVWRRGFSRNQL